MKPFIPIKSKPRPVESFGPEILAALLRGATEPLVLPMPYKLGVRFRLRVHQLREAMRCTNHEKYKLCARVRVTIEWPLGTPTEKSGRHIIPSDRNTMCVVTLKPNDTEFADLLLSAGIDPLSGTIIELPAPDIKHPDLSALEEMLKDIK